MESRCLRDGPNYPGSAAPAAGNSKDPERVAAIAVAAAAATARLLCRFVPRSNENRTLRNAAGLSNIARARLARHFVVGAAAPTTSRPTPRSTHRSSFVDVSPGLTESGPIANAGRQSQMRTRCRSTPAFSQHSMRRQSESQLPRWEQFVTKTTMSPIVHSFSIG